MIASAGVQVVLGASGGAGAAIVRALLDQGETVRAVTRDGKQTHGAGGACAIASRISMRFGCNWSYAGRGGGSQCGGKSCRLYPDMVTRARAMCPPFRSASTCRRCCCSG